MAAQLDLPTKGNYKKCCHAGDALLLFALGWPRRRKPPNAPDSFTAHPVPLSGFTSPNSRRMQPRPGRGVTGPPRPKSKLPGVALRRPLPAPRGPGSGRCSNAPSPLLIRNNFEVPTRPCLSPREVLLCHQAVGNSASRMHYTLKTRSKQGGEDASVHHVCIVFPFRRKGTCQ